jgi:predicted DNA-binding transcriptional regulator AlpA
MKADNIHANVQKVIGAAPDFKRSGDDIVCPVTDDSKLVLQLTVNDLRQIIGKEVASALENATGHALEKEKLLSAQQAAEILGVNIQWLYRHAHQLPFARRISRKNLRFSEPGLRRWIAAKKR